MIIILKFSISRSEKLFCHPIFIVIASFEDVDVKTERLFDDAGAHPKKNVKSQRLTRQHVSVEKFEQ